MISFRKWRSKSRFKANLSNSLAEDGDHSYSSSSSGDLLKPKESGANTTRDFEWSVRPDDSLRNSKACGQGEFKNMRRSTQIIFESGDNADDLYISSGEDEKVSHDDKEDEIVHLHDSFKKSNNSVATANETVASANEIVPTVVPEASLSSSTPKGRKSSKSKKKKKRSTISSQGIKKKSASNLDISISSSRSIRSGKSISSKTTKSKKKRKEKDIKKKDKEERTELSPDHQSLIDDGTDNLSDWKGNSRNSKSKRKSKEDSHQVEDESPSILEDHPLSPSPRRFISDQSKCLSGASVVPTKVSSPCLPDSQGPDTPPSLSCPPDSQGLDTPTSFSQKVDEKKVTDNAVLDRSEGSVKSITVSFSCSPNSQGPKDTPALSSEKNPFATPVQKNIRGFSFMFGNIDDQKEFLAAFDADSSDDEEVESAKEKREKNDSARLMLIQMQKYESALEKERTEMTEERESMKLKQVATEQLLNDETTKNAELESQIKQLEEQFDNTHEKLEKENIALKAEVECLQERNGRHHSMMKPSSSCRPSGREGEMPDIISFSPARSEKRRTGDKFDSRNYGPLVVEELSEEESTISDVEAALPLTKLEAIQSGVPKDFSAPNRRFRGQPPQHDEISEDLSLMGPSGRSVDFLEDENESQSGYMSMSSLRGQAQGELLQLRSTLKYNKTAFQLQSKELANVRQELETLREERGVKNLQTYVQNLKQEKNFFVSELDRLKKELDASRKREQHDADTTSRHASSSSADSGIGGWFGSGGNKWENDENDTSTGGPRGIASQAALEKAERISQIEEGKPNTLDRLLDF